MSYIDEVLQSLQEKAPQEVKFHQAVKEVLDSLRPLIEKNEEEYRREAFLERLTTPERVFIFRVPWVNDKGETKVNTGYRVQFNGAIGPYKGGLRFRENVDLDGLKFLAFEQTFKNSLTGLPMGGGKGGSDFDPKGKSNREVMAFCQSFMTELQKYIGPDTDVPAGDLGVGAREIGYLFGQYRRLHRYEGVLTGKGLAYGGSLVRPEATGYGLLYFTEELLKDHGTEIRGKKVVVSGSGNVAIYAIEKAQQLGALCIGCSDTDGYVYDPEGIDLDLLKQVKLNERKRMKDYAERRGCEYHEGHGVWTIPCDIALPCAAENEVTVEDAKELVKNGCLCLCEGANMPCYPETVAYLQTHGVLYAPGKAANAGGVAVSGLEMSQNALHLSWTFEEVDQRLKGIMHGIYHNCTDAARANGTPDDLLIGANQAGFRKVAEAMKAQGVI
ncbi:MAG: NADP-specific glutamate dehydrogenase [Erysipelotrichaceae bacterium]|nr:NADP-specific glutamate dehydrogenase [Erysipelotrichaceae bacterium]